MKPKTTLLIAGAALGAWLFMTRNKIAKAKPVEGLEEFTNFVPVTGSDGFVWTLQPQGKSRFLVFDPRTNAEVLVFRETATGGRIFVEPRTDEPGVLQKALASLGIESK